MREITAIQLVKDLSILDTMDQFRRIIMLVFV